MYLLTDQDRAALAEVSAALGVSALALEGLIAFESNWKPDAKNPLSSARGLIQFTDATARGLGFKDSADLVRRNPTRAAQLRGPVLSYLRRYMPFDSTQSLHMAVFYPAYRRAAASDPFPATVQRVNPGIRSPADYMALVARKLRAIKAAAPALGGLVLVLIAGGIFIYTQTRKAAAT